MKIKDYIVKNRNIFFFCSTLVAVVMLASTFVAFSEISSFRYKMDEDKQKVEYLSPAQREEFESIREGFVKQTGVFCGLFLGTVSSTVACCIFAGLENKKQKEISEFLNSNTTEDDCNKINAEKLTPTGEDDFEKSSM